jgi:hypothetical protein
MAEYVITTTSTSIHYFTRGALSRKYMLIPHLKKRKKDSKKNEGNIREPC